MSAWSVRHRQILMGGRADQTRCAGHCARFAAVRGHVTCADRYGRRLVRGDCNRLVRRGRSD